MAGRRPDPLEKRVAKGNPQRRPLPKTAPTRIDGEIEPPATLTDGALDCWKRVSQVLSQRGQLTLDSYWSLVALCECFAEWDELRIDIKHFGRTQRVRIKDGDPDDDTAVMERQRPQVSMFQDADRRLKSWLTEFGLTDASRGKVIASKPPVDKASPGARYNLN